MKIRQNLEIEFSDDYKTFFTLLSLENKKRV